MSQHSSSRRGLGRTLLAALVVLGVGVLAVVGVVVALGSLDSEPTVTSCTASGQRLAPDQAANAALIVGTAVRRELPARAGTIGIATAMQESRMRSIDYGDRDSLGMFQQRPSQGWGTPEEVMDPVYAVNIFYDHLVQVPGYTDLEVTVAAQAVQRSAYPDAYAQHEPLARAFASALSGWEEAALTCTLTTWEGEAEAVVPAAQARLERDLGVVAGTQEGAGGEVELVLDASQVGTESDRLAWAAAHMLVAAAGETGVGRVAVDGWVWERSEASWRPLEPDEPAPAPAHVLASAG